MATVHSLALQETLEVERVIDHLKGTDDGPTVVFFGGIHGNEPAGVFALKQVFGEIRESHLPIRGEVYGLAGNLGALQNGTRYQKEDLNRIWFPNRIDGISLESSNGYDEELELQNLYALLREIIKNGKPPFYFLDLHTTSSDSSPFMVMNDSLLNRKFASQYPLPVILGIEEYLHGALLSYINELGYVSLGFESGQHDDEKAIENSVNFVQYSLGLTQSIALSERRMAALKWAISRAATAPHKFYEIYHQHDIGPDGHFKMFPGFVNFQVVAKGRSLAMVDGVELKTTKKRQIFMPLYQKQGSEGFYFIKPVPRFLLWLSKQLRQFKVDHLLVCLPGVAWRSKEKDTLVVDQKVARFFAKSVFHLLGYRARQFDATHLVVKSRERASKSEEYRNTPWFKL